MNTTANVTVSEGAPHFLPRAAIACTATHTSGTYVHDVRAGSLLILRRLFMSVGCGQTDAAAPPPPNATLLRVAGSVVVDEVVFAANTTQARSTASHGVQPTVPTDTAPLPGYRALQLRGQARGWVSGTWFVGLGGRHIEGGALQVTDAATANVTTTSFAGCGALHGGAVAVAGEHSAAWTVGAAAEGAASRVAVEGCLFNRNAAVGGAGDGGAIYAAAPNGTDVAPPTVDVTQCTLLRNTAYRGGGVYAANATVAVSRSVVRDNTAMFGGGIEFDAASVASVTMTWFLDNIAGLHGGGMRAVESVLTADACVFDGNRAHLTDGYGGGVSVYDGSVATMTRIVVGTVSMSRDQVLAVACNTRTDFQSNTTVFNTVSVIDGAGATGSVTARSDVVVQPQYIDDECAAALPYPPHAALFTTCEQADEELPVTAAPLACVSDDLTVTTTTSPGEVVGIPHASGTHFCTFVLEAPAGWLVQLLFCGMDVEPKFHGVCVEERVTVFDGDHEVGTYCGDETPPPVVSSGSTLRLSVAQRQGTFRARWTFVPTNTASRVRKGWHCVRVMCPGLTTEHCVAGRWYSCNHSAAVPVVIVCVERGRSVGWRRLCDWFNCMGVHL